MRRRLVISEEMSTSLFGDNESESGTDTLEESQPSYIIRKTGRDQSAHLDFN